MVHRTLLAAALLLASRAAFGQTHSTAVYGGGAIIMPCPGIDDFVQKRQDTPSVDSSGARKIVELEVGPLNCTDPSGAVVGTVSAEAVADVKLGSGSGAVSASSSGEASGSSAFMNLGWSQTVTLKPPAGSTDNTVTVGVLSPYAYIGLGKADYSLANLTLNIDLVDGVPPSIPVTVSKQFGPGSHSEAGMLATDDITILSCPCSITYDVVISLEVAAGQNESSSVAIFDPVSFKLPPGWTYTPASPTGCSAEFDRSGVSLAGFGDQGTVNLSIPAGCQWTASSDSAWLRITGGASGSGSGRVRYAADPNTTGAARSGILTIAGNSFLVDQAAQACGFTLSAQSLGVDAAGATGSINVNTGSSCAWTPESADWVAALPTVPAGSGAAQFAAEPNLGPLPRTASISIAGQWIQVLQTSPNPVEVFPDVPTTDPYFNYIWLMKANGITSGCGSTGYCPGAPVTRGQMAVFIIRALMGDTFPHQQTPYFTDVPASNSLFAYVQKMRELGITSGCSSTAYCPSDPVTRGQMAVFIVRARLGLAAGDTFAFPTTPYFSDIPASDPYFSFIQKMKDLGVTSGCSPSAYCENDSTTRAQMAVFIVRGLLTP